MPPRRVKSPPKNVAPANTPTTATALDPAFKSKFHKRIELSPDSLRAIFEKSRADREASTEGRKTNKLLDLISNRIKDGFYAGFSNARVYAAIDEAMDASFNQPSAALIDKIMAKGLKPDDILKELKLYGISESTLFTDGMVDVIDSPNGSIRKVPGKILNENTFYKVLVPMVKSVLMARGAKLFNDRNQNPLLSYQPVINTEENRMVCEVITNLISKVSHQMGYGPVLREAILNALLYAGSIIFPAEVWYSEQDEKSNGDKFATKEGLRYQVPHPTKWFADMHWRLSTINTDTGVTYAGWWRPMLYGDIEANPSFYNKQTIPFGTNWFAPNISQNYFTELYPCSMRMPPPPSANQVQRDDKAAFYSTNLFDKAVFVTDYYMKLVPSQWGLGKWKYPIWIRFVMASETTVLFAEPYPYCPLLYMGADAIEGRARNSSLAQDIVPFQVHIGNILSHIILSAKQNLAKVVYYDTEIVDEGDIKNIKAQSKDSSGILFVPFSSKKARVAQVGMNQIFMPLQFPLQNTGELTSTINTIIAVMERLLGISSQEVGAAGVHVQTAEESRIISNNTSNRVEFTGTWVDDFLDAWKRQNYLAAREFMDEEFVSEVTATTKESIAKLKKVGFKLSDDIYDGKVKVSGEKNILAMEGFVSTREGSSRINQPQVAQVMMQTIQAVAANQELAQIVGADQILAVLNIAAQLSGAPKDFKLRANVAQQQLVRAQQMLQQIAKQIEQSSVQTALKAAQPLAKQVVEQGQELQQVEKQTEAAIQQLGSGQEQLGQAVQQISEQVKGLQGLISAALQSFLPQSGAIAA